MLEAQALPATWLRVWRLGGLTKGGMARMIGGSSKSLTQCPNLNGISQGRASPMHADKAQVLRLQSCCRQGCSDQGCLSRTIGGCEPAGPACLVVCGPCIHTKETCTSTFCPEDPPSSNMVHVHEWGSKDGLVSLMSTIWSHTNHVQSL